MVAAAPRCAPRRHQRRQRPARQARSTTGPPRHG